MCMCAAYYACSLPLWTQQSHLWGSFGLPGRIDYSVTQLHFGMLACPTYNQQLVVINRHSSHSASIKPQKFGAAAFPQANMTAQVLPFLSPSYLILLYDMWYHFPASCLQALVGQFFKSHFIAVKWCSLEKNHTQMQAELPYFKLTSTSHPSSLHLLGRWGLQSLSFTFWIVLYGGLPLKTEQRSFRAASRLLTGLFRADTITQLPLSNIYISLWFSITNS